MVGSCYVPSPEQWRIHPAIPIMREQFVRAFSDPAMTEPEDNPQAGSTLPEAGRLGESGSFGSTSVDRVVLGPSNMGSHDRATHRGLMKRCVNCGARLRSRHDRCPMDGGTLETLEDPLLGELLAGRYLIEEKIGSGGMSTVYRAHHHYVGRELAIKILTPAASSDPSVRRRFVREAQAINRISHHHIVQVLDFGETAEGEAYLVMEYLRGKTLGDVLKRGALPAQRAIHIVRQVAEALARAHELDVIHRDIKPSNVFLVRDVDRVDFVKLLDFGISKVLDASSTQTEAGTVLGTPEYMAPEQVTGERLGPQTDLYSLGCILYQALKGQAPFSGTVAELLRYHTHNRPDPLGRDDIPAALEQITFRLLEKRPEDRHRDAHHLIEELSAVAGLLPSAEKKDRSTVDPPAPAFVPRRTMNMDEQVWAKRVELYHRLARRVYGDDKVPSWLSECLHSIEQDVAKTAALHQALAQTSEQGARSQQNAQAIRIQIGLALDELSRDESRLRGEISSLEMLVLNAEQVQEELADQLSHCVEQARPRSDRMGDTLLRVATNFAKRRADLIGLRSQLSEKRHLIDDLMFQIRQLKDRLDTFNSQEQAEREDRSQEANRLSNQLREVIVNMMDGMERAYSHLSTFPELGEALSSY